MGISIMSETNNGRNIGAYPLCLKLTGAHPLCLKLTGAYPLCLKLTRGMYIMPDDSSNQVARLTVAD